MWKIKLLLEGGLIHVLGDVRSGNPGWAQCNPSKILRIEFPFFGRDEFTGKDVPYKMVLAGMKEYNFFVEAVRGVSGRGKTKIKGLWFMGKLPNSDRIRGFVLKESIMSLDTIVGQEYHGISTVGWKTGSVGDKVVSTIIRGSL